MFRELMHFLYPDQCPGCKIELLWAEGFLCTSCRYSLPYTSTHFDEESAIDKKFRGRSHVEFADAMTYYIKGGMMQRLIHELKYEGRQKIGEELGFMYGQKLKHIPILSDLHSVIPVPLHVKKQRKRGYNQAACIAEGLGRALEVPVRTNILNKRSATGSQTLKDLYSRWKNTDEVFQINQKFQDLEGKHFLVVDDVITTGATLCACVDLLTKITGVKVSVAAISFTKK